MTRAAIVAAIEALAVGSVSQAERILLDLLDALEGDVPAGRPFSCDTCGAAFSWPGALDEHRELLHTASEPLTAEEREAGRRLCDDLIRRLQRDTRSAGAAERQRRLLDVISS